MLKSFWIHWGNIFLNGILPDLELSICFPPARHYLNVTMQLFWGCFLIYWVTTILFFLETSKLLSRKALALPNYYSLSCFNGKRYFIWQPMARISKIFKLAREFKSPFWRTACYRGQGMKFGKTRMISHFYLRFGRCHHFSCALL